MTRNRPVGWRNESERHALASRGIRTKVESDFKSKGVEVTNLKRHGIKSLTGGTIEDLRRNFFWLLEADIEDAVIEIDSGYLYWYSRDWHGGHWHDGVWHDGVWHGGEWRGGEWERGYIKGEYSEVSPRDREEVKK